MTATIETTEHMPFATETAIGNIMITTTCYCAYCAMCEMGVVAEYGEECYECGSTEHMEYALDYCNGACNCDREVIEDYLNMWKAKHRNKYVLAIAESNHPLFGTPRTGYMTMKMDRNFIDAIAPNTDWTQRWSVDAKRGGEVTCMLSHHDQPMGERITFRPMTTAERAHIDYHGFIVLDENSEMVTPCEYCKHTEGKCADYWGNNGCGNMVIWI